MKFGKSIMNEIEGESNSEEAESLLDASPEEIKQIERKQIFEWKAVVREALRKRSVIGIIKYLLNHKVARLDEIAKNVPSPVYSNRGLASPTTHKLLEKMEKSGIVMSCIPPLDRRHIYFQLNPDFPINRLIQRYHWNAALRLYTLIPYEGIRVEDLKRNPQFIEACKQYFMTVDETVDALAELTRKIRAEYSTYPEKRLYKLYRKEQ